MPSLMSFRATVRWTGLLLGAIDDAEAAFTEDVREAVAPDALEGGRAGCRPGEGPQRQVDSSLPPPESARVSTAGSPPPPRGSGPRAALPPDRGDRRGSRRRRRRPSPPARTPRTGFPLAPAPGSLPRFDDPRSRHSPPANPGPSRLRSSASARSRALRAVAGFEKPMAFATSSEDMPQMWRRTMISR